MCRPIGREAASNCLANFFADRLSKNILPSEVDYRNSLFFNVLPNMVLKCVKRIHAERVSSAKRLAKEGKEPKEVELLDL